MALPLLRNARKESARRQREDLIRPATGLFHVCVCVASVFLLDTMLTATENTTANKYGALNLPLEFLAIIQAIRDGEEAGLLLRKQVHW